MNKRPNVILTGFMGTGKTSVARRLAEILDFTLIETDTLIEQKIKMPISEAFERFGEDYFRSIEAETIASLANVDASVISCGGGAVLRRKNVEILKRIGVIVLLTASPETVWERVRNSESRPVLKGGMNTDHISSLMEKRAELYNAAADLSVSTDGKTLESVCKELLAKL